MGTEQLSFSWQNHQVDIINTFKQLFLEEVLVDVTLTCEGFSLEAHKIVLSLCSPYFRSLFQKNRCEHPIVIMANVKYKVMKSIVDFIYNGEVTVLREHVTEFLQVADLLQIKGLSTRPDYITRTIEDVINDDNVHVNGASVVPSTSREITSSASIRNGCNISSKRSSIDSTTECLPEEISIHNNESEFMETEIVKSEPDYNYEESCDEIPSSMNDNIFLSDTTCAQPRTNSDGKSVVEEQRMLENCPLEKPVPNVEIPLSYEVPSIPILLSESNIPLQINKEQWSNEILLPDNIIYYNATTTSRYTDDEKPQTALLSYEEPKVLVNYCISVNDGPSVGKTSENSSILNSSTDSLNSETEIAKSTTSKEIKRSVKEYEPSLFSSTRRKFNFYQSRNKRRWLRMNYMNSSKFGKSSRKRRFIKSFNPHYDCNCSQKCAKRISVDTRMKLFKHFQDMTNCGKQNAFIRATVTQTYMSNKSKTKCRHRFGRTYKLDGVTVCYQMYSSTLKINTYHINNAFTEVKTFLKRTEHTNIKTTKGKKYGLSAKKIKEVIDHLDKFFKYISNRKSKHVPVEFIIDNLPVQKIYDAYKKNTPFPVNNYLFTKIFKNDFMLSLNERNYENTNHHQLNSNKDKAKLVIKDQTKSIHSPRKQIGTESNPYASSSNEINQQQRTISAELMSTTIENVPNPLDKFSNRGTRGRCTLYKVDGQQTIRKVNADDIKKLTDHFNEFYNASRLSKTDVNFSTSEFWKSYKIYKREVSVPVSFYYYVKIFNTKFKYLGQRNTAVTIERCKTTTQGYEIVTRQQSSVKVDNCQNFNKLPIDKSTEINEENKIDNIQNCNTNTSIQMCILSNEQRLNEVINSCLADKQNSLHTNICNSNKDKHQSTQKQEITMYNLMYKKSSVEHECNNTVSHIQIIGENQIKSSLTDEGKTKETSTIIQSGKDLGNTSGIQGVIDHFNEFHDYVSYHNKNIPSDFVNSNLPLMKMYWLYRKDAVEPVTYHEYFNIFCNFKHLKDKQEHSDNCKNKPKVALDNQNNEINLKQKPVEKDHSGNSKDISATVETQKSKSSIADKKHSTEIKLQNDIKCQHAVICLDKLDIPLELQNNVLCLEDSNLGSNSLDFAESEPKSIMQHNNCIPNEIPLKLEKSMSYVNNKKEMGHSDSILNNNSVHSNKPVPSTAQNKVGNSHQEKDINLSQHCNSFVDNKGSSETQY